VLILVHELGHFAAAKATGIQVLRFSIGFGPPILSWRIGETEYRLAWVPVGGYVKMAGLEDEGMAGELEGGTDGVAVDPARAFDRKPIWVRIVVLTAGVAMNVVLAFLVYTGLAAFHGTPRLATTQIDSVVVSTLPPGAESLRELRFGDRILRINGDTVSSWDDVIEHIAVDTQSPSLAFQIAGRPDPLLVQLRDRDVASRRALARSLVYLVPPRLGIVNPGEPAARAGLRVGDVVTRVNDDSVRSWGELVNQIRRNPDTPVRLELQRDGELVTATVVPKPRGPADTVGGALPGEGMMGALGKPDRLYVPEPFPHAVILGAEQTLSAAGAIVYFLARLVSGHEPLGQLGGPVLIGQISGQVIRLGVHDFLAFIAFFSVQLAVLNLLPIPVLDGGHLVFLFAEALRGGRPIPVTVRVRLLNIGFWILIAIMVVAFGNDVFRILPR
jgi:regulator of sigma E protease